MTTPIDEHALLVAVRQNNRIARLAEPLKIFWIGSRVDFVFHVFVVGMQALCAPVTIVLEWDKIVFGLRGE